MKAPRVTLDQWRTLQAVVDHGGFAQAAEALHRSQSSVSYTVARMQEQLGAPLLRIDGRKAVLTEAGKFCEEVLFPINLIGEFANPISISLRLFANMLSGVIIMGLWYGMMPVLLKIGIPAALHVYCDLFSGCIQTYVFCMLTWVKSMASPCRAFLWPVLTRTAASMASSVTRKCVKSNRLLPKPKQTV